MMMSNSDQHNQHNQHNQHEGASLSERQQRAIERISEDERLTSDLTDTQALPLLQWAREQAALAAAAAQSSEEEEHALRRIRRAVRRVAASAADVFDAARLHALACAALDETEAEETSESESNGEKESAPPFIEP